MWSVLVGCATPLEGGSVPPIDVPGLVPESPAPGAWIDDGQGHVTGWAVQLSGLTLDGAPLDAVDSWYDAPRAFPRGVTTLALSGTAPGGEVHQATYSVLAGDTAPAEGRIRGAIGVHLGQAALDSLGPMLEQLLDPATLLGGASSTPIVDDGTYTVWLDGIEMSGLTTRSIPQDGSLLFGIGLADLVVHLSVDAEILFIPIGLDADLVIRDAELLTEVWIDTDGQGGLEVSVDEPILTFQEVEVDVDDVADFLEDLFLSDSDARAMLEDQIGTLTAEIPGLVDGLLGELDSLGTIETELVGTTIALSPYFQSAGVTPDGVDLGIDLDLTVGDGKDHRYLASAPPPQPGGDDLVVALSDDLVNRALTDLWAAGALNLDLPVEAGSVESAILLLFGGGGGGGALKVEAGLPPVLVERDGQARIQIGEWKLGVDVPGGRYGDHLDLGLHADIAADFVFDGTTLSVSLSDAQLVLSPTGDADPALVAQLPTIAQGMAGGIGLLESLLAFPLDGLLGGGSTTTTGDPSVLSGISLPPMTFSRDGSGLGTRIDAAL
ncbi:MAG: hypothetical protein ABMA64_32745 [Myxococcota bacterium]